MEAYRSGHNEPDSKSGVPARVPWVRIPPLPPNDANQNTTKVYFTKKVIAVIVRFAK